MQFQTCSRHPGAGRFLAECSGCKRELFDIQARNEARMTTARAALAAIGTEGARILSITEVDTAIVVATHQPGAYFEYCVDTFRRPTAAETDPDRNDAIDPSTWVLIEQNGAHTPDTGRMVADALDYLTDLGITNEPTPAAA